MSNKRGRGRAARNKGARRIDYISQLSDELLLIILSFLPIKDAVVTSGLSKRWSSLWYELEQLNFDGSDMLDKMAKDRKLCDSMRAKYIEQVNGVLENYYCHKLREFRIRFDLGERHKSDIDTWLKDAVYMRVETLELDLMESGQDVWNPEESYKFPIKLSERNVTHLFKWQSSKATLVEIPSLRKLVLKNVNVTNATLLEIVTNSPLLEMVSIHGAGRLKYIHVGGRELKLKHFEIAYCPHVRFIKLFDFDLVSFTYKGKEIALDLVNLPELKEVDIGEGLAGLENNVFRQISSCLANLQVLSVNIYLPKESLKLDSIPELPNVKKLRLTIGALQDDCLLEFTSIARACPGLETFAIELLWLSPIKRRRKVTHVANHPHEHLKLFEFVGYFGRISDLELAVYVIDNAVALKKLVIDPRGQVRRRTALTAPIQPPLKTVEAARSSAKRQLESLVPPGVQLAIL